MVIIIVIYISVNGVKAEYIILILVLILSICLAEPFLDHRLWSWTGSHKQTLQHSPQAHLHAYIKNIFSCYFQHNIYSQYIGQLKMVIKIIHEVRLWLPLMLFGELTFRFPITYSKVCQGQFPSLNLLNMAMKSNTEGDIANCLRGQHSAYPI